MNKITLSRILLASLMPLQAIVGKYKMVIGPIRSIALLDLAKTNIAVVIVAILSASYLQSAYACSNWINTIDGSYQLQKAQSNVPNELLVRTSSSLDKFNFQITSFWMPQGKKETLTPSIGFFKGIAQLRGCVALYQVSDETNNNCSLVFVFMNTKSIQVTSFGDCGYGYNAYPDGRYEQSN